MNKYLVIQGARLGDLLQTKRLILTLNNQGTVFILLDRGLCEIAQKIYPFANIHGINFHHFSAGFSLEKDLEVFKYLSNINFNSIFNCNYSSLTTCICRLFEPDKVIGYRPCHCPEGGILRSDWARIAFRLASNRKINPLNLVDFWGWFWNTPIPYKEVAPPAEPNGDSIGVAVSGRDERRSLPPAILANIIKIIFNSSNCKNIKLFGTINEVIKAKKILHLLRGPFQEKIINLVGKTDLLSLYDELSSLEVLITPDTGIMHLAAYCGIPVIAFFFSSANCHETGPYGLGHIIFQSTPSCGPCLENSKCVNNIKCLFPYENKSFYKLLIDKYKNNNPITTSVEGLQCWETDFDNFGQTLKLSSGQDMFAGQRHYLRRLIKFHHGVFDREKLFQLAQSEETSLIESIFPTSEWMLPSWRYV